MTFFDQDIAQLRARISEGESTARSITESALDAAEKSNVVLNAFLQIDRDGALRRADEISSLVQSNDASSLLLGGVPVAIKDNICVRGLQASCGSRILGDYHPPYDATAVKRLREAGAVIIGKTNCDEFAMGSSNENSAYGSVRNPWDTSRVPGGRVFV